ATSTATPSQWTGRSASGGSWWTTSTPRSSTCADNSTRSPHSQRRNGASMAGTTELVTVDPGRVAAVSGAHFTNDQVEVIRNLFAAGATEDELVVFLSIAQKYDLDPFAREIWCICELDAQGERKTDRNGKLRPPMIQA